MSTSYHFGWPGAVAAAVAAWIATMIISHGDVVGATAIAVVVLGVYAVRRLYSNKV